MHGALGLDPFDPRFWDIDVPHECRIYGDDHANIWALVDAVDYQWAIKWLWRPKLSRGGRKVYLYRTACGNGLRRSAYLHVEIMRRTEIIPPSKFHTITDHRNGNSLDCRRANLRWATPSMNRRNLFGAYPNDLLEG